MANETTTTTMNDVTYAAAIVPVMLDYLHDWVVASQYLRPFNANGRGSASVDIPSLESNMGTVGDGGGGVDTEFNATQATSLSNTAVSTAKVTLTSVEYGVAHDITDNVFEDSIAGLDLMNAVLSNMARILQTAFEDDVCALFAGLTASVGTTTVALSVADMIAAQTGIRTRGARAQDGVAYVLDENQAQDLENALTATNSAAAVYAAATDRLLGVTPGPNHGLSNGHVLNFRGYPVWATGLTDTANAGADVVGGCFVPSTPANDPMATFGVVTSREFRLETDRDIKLRATQVVATMRKGAGELLDGSGTKIVTDAG
jgi:hypothetical protein